MTRVIRRKNTLVGLSFYYNQQNNLLLVGDQNLPANVIDSEVYLDLDGSQKRTLTNTVNGGKSTSKGIDLNYRGNYNDLSVWSSYSYVDYNATLGSISSIASFHGSAKTLPICLVIGSLEIILNLDLGKSLENNFKVWD